MNPEVVNDIAQTVVSAEINHVLAAVLGAALIIVALVSVFSLLVARSIIGSFNKKIDEDRLQTNALTSLTNDVKMHTSNLSLLTTMTEERNRLSNEKLKILGEVRQSVTTESAAIQKNSANVAKEAVKEVEEKINGAADSLQTSINLIADQVGTIATLLGGLEKKVDRHSTTDTEMKTAINAVKTMAEETLSLIKARQDVTGEVTPVRDLPLVEVTPVPNDAA